MPTAHATSAAPPAFLTSPSFLFSPSSSFLLAVLSSQQCCISQCSFPSCSSALLHCTPEMGPWASPPDCKAKVCTVCHLLPPTPSHPSPFPASSGFTSSTELCGIKILQSKQNSHGHQLGREREQIWLQREIQRSYANARMAIGFCRLAKFSVSVPLYLIQAPA